MASDIDTTVPEDGIQVDKALLRANFAAAASEIEELQRKTSLAWSIATGQTSLTGF